MRPLHVFYIFMVGIFLGAVISYSWNKPGSSIPGQVSKELSGKTPTQEVRTVYVYPKTVNKKLQVDPAISVLTATKVGDKTITSGMDAEGHTTLFIRTDALPWFDKVKKHHFEGIWGSMDGQMVKRIQYSRSLYGIKEIDINIHGGMNIGKSEQRARIVGVSISRDW